MTQVAAVYSFASANMASFMTGLGISSTVFLILTAQVWIYFWRHKIRSQENMQTKALVTFIWLIQAAQMVIITRLSSIHTMEFEDRSRFLGHLLTEWALYTGIGSLTTSLVHGVFVYRVFRLEKCLYGRRRISFVLIAFCVMDYSVTVIWSISISLGCSAINDVLIAGTLAYILHKHRTTSPRTNQMITKLIIFCSQTGLITTVAASITVGLVNASFRALTMALAKIQWAVGRFEINHLYMCFPIGGCESLVVINSSTRNVLTS
ncbi:hypothetical protein F4604DRAFT_291974 [Suillus subluteus]|nr:hypothetical protein F4604DRAFT_291974 [Suillus subluteus]